MRATLLMGTLLLMAACAEQPTYQNPAPMSGPSASGPGYTPSEAYPCNRSDYPAGPTGETEYTNCVIQS